MSTPPAVGSPFHRRDSPLPLLYGHRGTRVHAPENSMGAFLWAAEAGADGVELDTRLCGSGQLVVFHDVDLKRMADLAWEISDTAYSQLTMVDLGDGYGIPLLSDVLDEMLSRGVLVNVEVKADGQNIDALNAAVQRELRGRDDAQRAHICVSSFSRRVLAAVLEGCPGQTAAALVESRERLPKADGDGAAADVRGRTAGLHPHHALLTPALLGEYRAADKFVNAWTVNDAAVARQLAADGVDGLITDDVEALKRAM